MPRKRADVLVAFCPTMADWISKRLQILARTDWQMSMGERAALEGILAQLRPTLSIEIGTAEGGSLERIAQHSDEVHAIDLTGSLLRGAPQNAVFHEGDSRVLLPALLRAFHAEGRNVDFALVDGDHSSEGAHFDLLTLLESPAVRESLILLHDTFNPEVRAGFESVGLASHTNVSAFDLDLIPGRLGKAGAFEGTMLGGFGVVVTGPKGAGIDMGLWSLRPDAVLVHDAYAAATLIEAVIRDASVAIEDSAARCLLDPAGIRRGQEGRKASDVHARE